MYATIRPADSSSRTISPRLAGSLSTTSARILSPCEPNHFNAVRHSKHCGFARRLRTNPGLGDMKTEKICAPADAARADGKRNTSGAGRVVGPAQCRSGSRRSQQGYRSQDGGGADEIPPGVGAAAKTPTAYSQPSGPGGCDCETEKTGEQNRACESPPDEKTCDETHPHNHFQPGNHGGNDDAGDGASQLISLNRREEIKRVADFPKAAVQQQRAQEKPDPEQCEFHIPPSTPATVHLNDSIPSTRVACHAEKPPENNFRFSYP